MGRFIARRCRYSLIGALCLICAVHAAPSVARPSPSPYPDIAGYDRDARLEKYAVTNKDGVWVTTPLGLRCAIEITGSFGCSGALHGVQSGVNEVAWFIGDPLPRLYRTDMPRFDSGLSQTILSAGRYIEYRGSRCAVTHDSAIYCIHTADPNSQIMVSAGALVRGQTPGVVG
ncbi:hypothetical protein MKOR_30480 [Mycolicibacillus koreensis]|nr:hypothetical protein MKOR_30480 [Mycolicibacillus koreensis]